MSHPRSATGIDWFSSKINLIPAAAVYTHTCMRVDHARMNEQRLIIRQCGPRL